MDGIIILKKCKDNMSCLRGPQNRGAEKKCLASWMLKLPEDNCMELQLKTLSVCLAQQATGLPKKIQHLKSRSECIPRSLLRG
jgi:hypothetical protein